jgi:hypothetical protein
MEKFCVNAFYNGKIKEFFSLRIQICNREDRSEGIIVHGRVISLRNQIM